MDFPISPALWRFAKQGGRLTFAGHIMPFWLTGAGTATAGCARSTATRCSRPSRSRPPSCPSRPSSRYEGSSANGSVCRLQSKSHESRHADTSRLDRTVDRAVIAERLLSDAHATSLCDDPLRVYRAVRRCPPTTGRSSPACRTWSSRPAPWVPTWPTLSCRPAAGAFSGEIHSKCGPSLDGGRGTADW
jgi:hypothetical protein